MDDEAPLKPIRELLESVRDRIARAVRGQTTVPPRWLAEQLVMGSAVKVSRLTAR
jgi:hypothetical protein